ncbi:MAG: mRNA interferase RelE/StbE [Thermotogaceae bacterium]|jgi:mRNA interferase RelE/StbE|nr:mRNA interferase RelE/StbE [Thermotogaceae bacterium]
MWRIKFCPEAKNDLKKLDQAVIKVVLAGIKKVSTNPLPQQEGGFGKPLGNVGDTNLTGFFKIKYKRSGIRVVYTIVRKAEIMNILVVSVRDKNKSYKIAQNRKDQYGKDLFKDIF